jgi:hypothetical protein
VAEAEAAEAVGARVSGGWNGEWDARKLRASWRGSTWARAAGTRGATRGGAVGWLRWALRAERRRP